MSVRTLYIVALCVTLLTHACLSAVVSPQEVNNSKEENVKKELEEGSISQEAGIENEDKSIKTDSKSNESSVSSSEEKGGDAKLSSESLSSESLENENSKEENGSKTKQKRSLDSDQGNLNTIGEGHNQTDENTSTESDKDVPVTGDDTETTVTGDADTTSTTANEDESELTETTETTSTVASDSPAEPDDETTVPSEETEPSEDGESFTEMALARADKLSEQIRKILKHYRKEGVVVVPGVSLFPEPMPVQDFEKSFSIGTVNFRNMKVYGLSNFTVEHINTDVDRMQVYILLHMKKLTILGNYSLRTFWSRSAGPCNVTLLNVSSEGVAAIETTEEGHLEASDSEMDMSTEQMLVDFKGMGSMIQSVVNTVGDAMFDSIKPQILDRVNLVIRKDVNEKLKDFSVKFVNKVAPVDLAFSEGRRYVREHGYDPLNIEQQTFVAGGLVNINISELTVKGLSRFNRMGNLSLSMDAGVIQFGVHVLTQELSGSFKWSGEAFGITRYGKTNFTIDHLQVRTIVNQSLDLTQKPQLEQLDLHLGWLKVTMDSPMALNMMVEGVINSFPRLIKHMIVDALEKPLKAKIQEILNKVNVESIVDSNLPRLDSFGL